MKSFTCFSFLYLFWVLCIFNRTVSSDNVYEQISSYIQYSDLIDPNSLYYNPVSHEIKVSEDDENDSHNNEVVIHNMHNHQTFCKDTHYEVFARRLINLLILNSSFKVKNGLAFGKIDLEATVEELDILKSFGEGKLSVRQIDPIISNIIRQPQSSLLNEALDFSDRIAIYLYQHRVIFGTLLLISFVIVIALKIKWTRLKIIFLMFDIVIIISFMLTWWELLQESEIKLAAQQHIYSEIPDECRKHDMNFFKSILLFFGVGKGDCLKYYEGVMADPVLQVTPLHAFSHMTMKLFFYPLKMASNLLSEFIENITSPLWFPFNLIAKLLLILSLPSFICSLIFISLGGSMGVRLGPFLHVYLHGKQSASLSNAIGNKDRQTIEVIRSEIREVDDNASAETKPALTMKKKCIKNRNIKTVQSTTQTEDTQNLKCIKQEENDSNSDDFPEESEYEKILKINYEEDLNPIENVKENIQHLENKTEENLNLRDCK